MGKQGSRCGTLSISKRAGAEQMAPTLQRWRLDDVRGGAGLREVPICSDYPSWEDDRRSAGETDNVSHRSGRTKITKRLTHDNSPNKKIKKYDMKRSSKVTTG